MSSFNLDWKFKKEGSEQWISIDLPYDAMLHETRNEYCHNGRDTAYFPGGKYVYEKNFSVCPEDVGKDIQILFEGVYCNCKVFLNGEYICSHMYGYTEFTADLTGKAVAGENTLAVTVDNSLEPNSRWYSGSGIYRPVHLEIREKNAPKLLRVHTLSVKPAKIQIQTEAGNTIEIWDGSAKVLEQTADSETTEIILQDAKLWSEEAPNLYTVIARNAFGELSSVIGIRLLQWDARSGLTVNGKRVLLRGGCIHHDNGVLGACEFLDAAERKVRILKQAGYNAIRSAHNPLSRAMLEACDSLGMYVMDEAFDGWYTPKKHHDLSRTIRQFWKDDLRAMVNKDFNHPCVVLYSIGNEMTETAVKEGQDFCGMLRDYMHELDASRPVTAGVNIALNIYNNKGKGVFVDEKPYEPVPLPPKTEGYVEKKTGSAFFNMMVGKMGGAMFYVSGGKKGDAQGAAIAPNLDVLGLNYGSSRIKPDLAKYPERLMVASETLATDLAYNWPFVKKYPAVLGDFVWTAWDYLGETGIGDYTYPSYKGLPLLAGCGTIDLTGKITAENYYQQIIWGTRKEPFIGVAPLNHAGETTINGAWRFTNAIDSWSWDGFEGKKAKIEVYADAAYIRLEQNGRVLGTKKLKKYKTSFHCRYKKGSLTAIALDQNKREIRRSILESGNAQTRLCAAPEKATIAADGMSLCFIPIEFTDSNQVLKPFIEESVSVTVEGPAVLAGLGSALAKTDECYYGNTFRAHRGRLLAVVRSTRQAGEITVRIKSASGLTASVTIQSR